MFQKAKIVGLHVLRAMGFFRFAKLLCRKQIRILTYHRFGKKYVTSQSLEKQVRFLKMHFNLIDLGSYIDFLHGRKELPPNSAIITVDDGYQDFYSEAFPILKKHAVPVTVFLTVDFIDERTWLWHDLLNFGISNTLRSDFTLNGNCFDLRNHRGKIELKLFLDNICTSCSISERDVLIRQVLKDLNVTFPENPSSDYAPLTWSQIMEMSGFGVTYGAHTCTHPVLSKIPPDEALREIRESKDRIEEVMQRDISTFCYPNGKENDFNEEVKNMVKECGFTCAMTTIYGMNNLDSDRYALRRMGLDRRSFIHFLHDVSGFGVLRHSLRCEKKEHSGAEPG